jgi:hypothetical protein
VVFPLPFQSKTTDVALLTGGMTIGLSIRTIPTTNSPDDLWRSKIQIYNFDVLPPTLPIFIVMAVLAALSLLYVL